MLVAKLLDLGQLHEIVKSPREPQAAYVSIVMTVQSFGLYAQAERIANVEFAATEMYGEMI